MPDFYPPVNEVALTVQFTEALPFTLADYAEIIALFGADLPQVQHAAALSRFGTFPVLAFTGSLNINVSGGALPRMWLISEDGHWLAQFQPDRISVNWRRVSPPGHPFEYPGFDTILKRFDETLERYLTWLHGKGYAVDLGGGCEVLYQNLVPLDVDGEERRLSDVFRFFAPNRHAPIRLFQAGWAEDLIPGGWEGGFLQVNASVVGSDAGDIAASASIYARFPTSSPDSPPITLEPAAIIEGMLRAQERIQETYPYVLTEAIIRPPSP